MFEWEERERRDEDVAADAYDRLYHGFPVLAYWDADFSSFVARFWREGDRVLDLGCATASLWDRWRTLPAPSRLVGVDISERMVEHARERFPEGEFHVARAHDLPFDDGSFDLVIASSVLHHIPDDHLAGAVAEIDRVLDEHGCVAGRDPIANRFGNVPGWFSGALMSFRHLTYRLTASREYPEPQLGDHHHVFDERVLVETLQQRLTIRAFDERYPFSSYVSRLNDDRLVPLVRRLDELVKGRGGSMVYYAAEKNFVDTDEMLRVIDLARDEVGPTSDAEFLAYLRAATEEISKLLGEAQPGGSLNGS